MKTSMSYDSNHDFCENSRFKHIYLKMASESWRIKTKIGRVGHTFTGIGYLPTPTEDSLT